MDERGANGPVAPITGKRTAQEAFGPQTGKDNVTRKMEPNALTNGDVKSPTHNGPIAEPILNGASTTSLPHNSQPQQPSTESSEPVLEHVTEGYRSLGQLIARSAQLCFNDLEKTLDKMATLPQNSSFAAELTNGVNDHATINGAGSAAKVDAEKRRLMLEFLNTHREKFIKLMVLADWSKNAKDVGKMIDLNVWFENQYRHFDNAKFMVGDIQRRLQTFKVRAPDIKTAVEILSTGKASWMPDLGYLPKPPLTPEKALQALRAMNTALNIRLNVYEDLPLYLRDYRIHDGRVTFSFPGEFELDVTIANEDPATPFYFVDVRFLFEPAPMLGSGFVRENLAINRLDPTLYSRGIPGCCDFLHNFVLTQKIIILRKQALAIRDGLWAGTLRVDQIHRSLIIQYWIDASKPKSWIEIGIASGKLKRGKKRFDEREWNSFIEVKWTRVGSKSTPLTISLDFNKLNMHAMLKKVIAAHINYILTSTRDKLLEAAAGSKALSVKLKTSDIEPLDCYLQLRLGNDSPWTKIGINTHSGRMFINPTGHFSQVIEKEINSQKDLALDTHSKVAMLLALEVQRGIERHASYQAWKPAKNIKFKIAELEKDVFKTKVLRMSFFYLPGWSNCNYILSLTISLDGCAWWIHEMEHRATGDHIVSTRAISQFVENWGSTVNRRFIAEMEHHAAQEIAFYTAVKQLNDAHVRNVVQLVEIPTTDRVETDESDGEVEGAFKGPTQQAVLHVNHKELMKQEYTNPTGVGSDIFIKLLHFNSETGYCEIEARGNFHVGAGQAGAFAAFEDPDVYFGGDEKSTEIGFYFNVPIGKSYIDQLISRIRSATRIRNYLNTLAASKFTPTKASLSGLSFTYSSDPVLLAEIAFSTTPDGPTRTREVLTFPASKSANPHRRLLAALSQLLNQPSPNAFPAFCKALQTTLPLARAFAAIETRMYARGDVGNPAVHARNVDAFRLAYANPACAWEVRLRPRRDQLEWLVSEAPTSFPILARADAAAPLPLPQMPPKEGRDEEFVRAVQAFFWDGESGGAAGDGDGAVRGMKSYVVAAWEKVGEAVLALDEVVTKYRKTIGKGGAKGNGADGAAKGPGSHGASGAGTGAAAKQKGGVAAGAEVVVLD